MKKNGFTLIEILAVIVIIALIALIATPLIGNVIKNARKSMFQTDCESIEKVIVGQASRTGKTGDYLFSNGKITLNGNTVTGVQIDNSAYSGNVSINDEGNVFVKVNGTLWCGIKEEEENTYQIYDIDSDYCK